MMRITMNRGYLTDQLLEAGWEPQSIMVVYDRIQALVDRGEDYIDIARRLNPAKATKPAWEPSPFRGPSDRVSPVRVRQRS